jgi:S-adenosylmethionine-dependent methyltransferase
MSVPTAEENFCFGPGVGAWCRGVGKVRDAVRQELVARQLAAHLPAVMGNGPPAVLDLGCGQGTQAIRLARSGCDVTGVDLSREMLDVARAAAAGEPPAVRGRLRFGCGDLLALDAEFVGRFDIVCCHGVLMYMPSLERGVAAVVAAARPGGLVSLLTRNRAGIAMRAGMSGRWAAASSSFDAHYYQNRLGIEQVRGDDPDEVDDALRAAGAERLCWYGVRLFSDHWEGTEVPNDFDELLIAEEEAGGRDPYRALCALTHTLAIRPRLT